MKTMKYFLVLLLAVLPHLIYAQSKEQLQIDSLLRAQTEAKGDTNEALLLIKVDSLYNTINPDRGIYYGDQAKTISANLEWKRGTGLANMTQGLNYKYKAEYKRALPLLFTAKSLFEQTGSSFDLGDCYRYIGIVYQDQKEFDTALAYYRKSLQIFEHLDNKTMIARVEGNMCNLYEYKGLYDSSLFYGFKALKIFQETGDKKYVATALGNISMVYTSMKNYDSALSFNQRALTLFEEAGDKVGIAIILGNIGETYWTRAKNSGATVPPLPTDTVTTNDLKQATDYFSRAISLSYDINQIENVIYLEPELADAYKLSGDYKTATETYERFIALKDSAGRNEDITALATIAANRELSLLSQEAQISALKKQNQLTILIASVVILVIIIVIVGNKFLAQVKSNKILAEEKKVHLEKIEAQATVLSDIAYTQSHDVRGEVATILGLAQIFNFENPDDPTNKIVIEGIAQVTEKLDAIVKSTIVQENELSGEIRLNPNKNTLG